LFDILRFKEAVAQMKSILLAFFLNCACPANWRSQEAGDPDSYLLQQMTAQRCDLMTAQPNDK